MGDDDDGRAFGAGEAAEKLDDGRAGLAVEVAGGLIGQDDRRLVGERSGDGDALLFAAAQPAWLALLLSAGTARLDSAAAPPVSFARLCRRR